MNAKRNKKNWERQSGQGLIEYAVLLIFAVAVVALVAALLGPSVGDVFSQIVTNVQDVEDEPPPTDLVVTVLQDDGKPASNQYVYLFSDAGNYLSNSGRTDANGRYAFADLAAGSYKVLVLTQTNRQYRLHWSPVVNFPQRGAVTIKLSIHKIEVQVVDEEGRGIAGATVYAFTSDYRYYAGVTGRTDGKGRVTMALPQGDYAFRAYYTGNLFWSEQATVPDVETAVIKTEQSPVTVHVVDEDAGVTGRVRVYLYSAAGQYLGMGQHTDKNGTATFNVPAGEYKFRADYRGQIFWSDTFDSRTVEHVKVVVTRR